MKNLFETINTIRAKGVNTPRLGTDDTTVPTVQGDMPAGKVEPNPADNYKAVKNRMAQVKTKIIDETNGETTMPQDKVSASFLEALNQVKANAVALDEKKHKKNKHGHDAVGHEDADIDNDGDVDSSDKYLHNRRKAIGKAIAKEEVEGLNELSKKTLTSYVKKAAGDAVTKAYRAGDVRDKDSGKNYIKALGRQIGISQATDKLAKEEVELEEAATVVLRKGGATKRMRYNPATIERMKAEGWVLASESFVEKVKELFSIEEEISLDDAIALVEEEQAKRGRGRPKKAVDPNAAPKKTWTPGGRGRPPKNKDAASKVSTSDTKAAAPAAKEPEKQDAGDTQHILVQLRKAATNEPGESGSGKNTIKYLNNTTGQVTASQARNALTMHDQIKTAGDRFKAQRRMGGSHEGLTGFLAGKEENTTAKPKVSLAQPGWNKK
jgi:hypothetical protein